MTNTVLNTKNGEVDNKILNYTQYFTTTQFDKFKAENFKETFKQTDLVSKNDNKLINFNKKKIVPKKQNMKKFKRN